MMRTRARQLAALLGVALLALAGTVVHADEAAVAVDTHELPQLGPDWRDSNPYSGQAKAIEIGTSAFNQNCARCHGLEAVSGGIAPDLRKLDRDCFDLASEEKKLACYKETDAYFLTSIRNGKMRDGAVKMPPFQGIFSQEAMWAIKSYLETRRTAE